MSHRARWSIVLAVAMVFSLGAYRYHFVPRAELGVPMPVFWANKFESGPADLFIAGTSRANHGLAPEVLTEVLGGTVNNFAFSGVRFTDDYLEAVDERIPEDGSGLVLIAPTPYAFSTGGEWPDGFLDEKARFEQPPLVQIGEFSTPRLLEEKAALDRFFGRMEIRGAVAGLGLISPRDKIVADWKDTGWSAILRTPIQHDDLVGRYSDLFQDAPAQAHRIEVFVDHVREWVDRGADVRLLRIPSSPEMELVEESRGGLDWDALREATEAVGARWIDLPPNATFETIDGSHFGHEEAVRFSRLIAEILLEERDA